MAISYKVRIPQVDVRPSDDTIRTVHWRVTGTDPSIIDPETNQPYQAVMYGTASVPEDTNVVFGTVTKAQVVNWLKNQPGSSDGQTLAQEVVANIAAQMDRFQNPAVVPQSKTELSDESDF
jgi:hypothetical protein